MDQEILILRKQDIEIIYNTFPSDQASALMQYQAQTYVNLNIAFNASQMDRAKYFCRKFQQDEGKYCLLVIEKYGYSVWSVVETKQPDTQTAGGNDGSFKNAQVTSGKAQLFASQKEQLFVDDEDFSITQVVLVTIQTIADDIEDLMGKNKKVAFYREVSRLFEQSTLPGTESPELVAQLLETAPLKAESLPKWQQKQLETVFPELAHLGKRYYGNTIFVEMVVDEIKSLTLYNRPQVADLCLQFVLLCK